MRAFALAAGLLATPLGAAFAPLAPFVDDDAASAATEEADAEPGIRLSPRTIEWEACFDGPFRRDWLLPDAIDTGQADLLARMRRLVAAEIPWKGDDGEASTKRFGDLVLAVRDLDDDARRRWLSQELPKRSPAFANAWRGELAQLLRDADLFGRNWKPSKDLDADGILFGEQWKLHEQEGQRWPERHDPVVEQAAALFLADMEAIKAAESDYRAYPTNVGADYEAIRPVEGSLVRGVDERDRPFNAHTLYFRCDLPFPFSDYECELHVLARTNELGEVVTDIYGPGDDFHYMGGRDTFLPVTTAAGDWVGFLNVRWFGFDLDGVPDGASNRREAMRGSLGNLRRNAERRFREAGGERRCEDGVVPHVPVRGSEED